MKTKSQRLQFRRKWCLKMVPVKEDSFDVKEELDSGSLAWFREWDASSNKPTVCVGNERPHELCLSNLKDQSGPKSGESCLLIAMFKITNSSRNDVMSEVRSVQQSSGQLRTQVEIVERNVDTNHIPCRP